MAANKTARVAVVTGASSGIGAATAKALASRGYHVIAGARRVERVRTVVGESGEAMRLDVTDRRSVEEFVRAIEKRHKHIDILVNYAGLKPLTADDIADCIVFAVTRPPHVDIDEIVIRPVAQATSFQVARNPGVPANSRRRLRVRGAQI